MCTKHKDSNYDCVLGLTGGLAAPLVAAGAGAIIGGAGAAALGSAAGVAIIGSLFGVAGAGLTGMLLGLRLLGPDIIKVFSCSTQLCMKFIQLKIIKCQRFLTLNFIYFDIYAQYK